jgi:hypothetical protein
MERFFKPLVSKVAKGVAKSSAFFGRGNSAAPQSARSTTPRHSNSLSATSCNSENSNSRQKLAQVKSMAPAKVSPKSKVKTFVKDTRNKVDAIAGRIETEYRLIMEGFESDSDEDDYLPQVRPHIVHLDTAIHITACDGAQMVPVAPISSEICMGRARYMLCLLAVALPMLANPHVTQHHGTTASSFTVGSKQHDHDHMTSTTYRLYETAASASLNAVSHPLCRCTRHLPAQPPARRRSPTSCPTTPSAPPW